MGWFPEARDIEFVYQGWGSALCKIDNVSMIFTFLVRLTTLLGEIMVRIVGCLHQDLIWGVGWRDYQLEQCIFTHFSWDALDFDSNLL